jgi:peptidoglycan hydrolase-like protein with peptidoglycan-binding domain
LQNFTLHSRTLSNKKIMKTIFLLIAILFTVNFNSFACNNSTISIASQVTNADGSVTYTLDLTTELGGLDATFYGFALSFNSAFNTPTVVIGGTFPTTTSLATGNLTQGSLSGTLQGLTGGNINSVVNDSDWNSLMNSTNVLSFESSELFGATSNDITMQIQVTVMGCVEDIDFYASVNSGSNSCIHNVSTGVSCASCSISAIAAGAQTPCVSSNNTYTQAVTITYNNPPASGTLDVNGQSFAITTSPQTVTLVGLVADGNAVNVAANFSANTGCTLTSNSLFTAPVACTPVCSLSGITAGAQTPCVSSNNTYTQVVTITYTNPPASGTLDVNGQSFAITTSPQTVTLTGLVSDGNAVNVTASFSADAGCTFTSNNLFTAPTACNAGCNPDNGTWD